MKRGILNIQVSTDEQADNDFSLRDQEHKLKMFCKHTVLRLFYYTKKTILLKHSIDLNLKNSCSLLKKTAQ